MGLRILHNINDYREKLRIEKGLRRTISCLYAGDFDGDDGAMELQNEIDGLFHMAGELNKKGAIKPINLKKYTEMRTEASIRSENDLYMQASFRS